MRRQLSAPAAWRHIAAKLQRDECVTSGLCLEIIKLRAPGLISWETKDLMHQQVRDHLAGTVYAYEPGELWAERAMACEWLALEAEEAQP